MRFFAILPYCNIWQDLATTFFWKFSSSLNVEHLPLVCISLYIDADQHRKILELRFWVSGKVDLEQIFHAISYQLVWTSWNNTFLNFSTCLSCWDLAETFLKISFKIHKQNQYQMFLKFLLWYQTTILLILANFRYILIVLKASPIPFSCLIGFMPKKHLILAIYH